MSEFPWLSFFVMEAEEERDDFLQFWQALVRELSENHQLLSLDKCHKKIVSEGNFPEHATNLNNLPVSIFQNFLLVPIDLVNNFAEICFSFLKKLPKKASRCSRVVSVLGSHPSDAG